MSVWRATKAKRVALELSSFKCGHDAPIYSVVEEVVEHSGTPYFCSGSIRIRVETTIEEQMAEFEARLRRQLAREKQHDGGRVRESFDTGAMPTIHVTLGALAASKPATVREYETVSGD